MTPSDSRTLVVRIGGFLGIDQVKVTLPKTSPVAVLGPNASGKTSVATAIAGVLCRTVNPLGLGPQKRAYIRDEDEHGEVSLQDSDSTELVRWEPGEQHVRVFSEAPEKASIHSMNLVDFTARSTPSARQKMWEDIFLPDPENLTAALGDVLRDSVPRDRQVHEAMETLRKHGWVVAEQTYSEHSKHAKREWQQITGEQWGVKKGQNWQPTGWMARHEGMTVLEAQAEVEAAREAQRALQVRHAVTEADKARADKAREEIPKIEVNLARAKQDFEQADAVATKLHGKFNDIQAKGKALRQSVEDHERGKPSASRDPEAHCPYPDCGRPLVVMPDGSVASPEQPGLLEERLKTWGVGAARKREELDSLREIARKARGALDKARETYNIKHRNKGDWAAKLDMMKGYVEAGEGDVVEDDIEDRIAAAEQKVQDATDDLRVVDKRAKAIAAHCSILEYTTIASALGPRGIRARAISDSLNEIHAFLKLMTDLTDWPEIELDRTYSVHLAGRPAVLCSESEKWRAQFLIQCALARKQGDQYVIADGADILDLAGHTNLLHLCDWLVENHGIVPIVCMTHDASSMIQVPDAWESVRLT